MKIQDLVLNLQQKLYKKVIFYNHLTHLVYTYLQYINFLIHIILKLFIYYPLLYIHTTLHTNFPLFKTVLEVLFGEMPSCIVSIYSFKTIWNLVHARNHSFQEVWVIFNDIQSLSINIFTTVSFFFDCEIFKYYFICIHVKIVK